MKLLLIILDGVGDRENPDLNGMTPLEAAITPGLDYLARRGRLGLMYTVSKGIAPESDVAVFSILGYDPFKIYTGRGPIEALGAGLLVRDEYDLALRCNFATIDEDWRVIDRRVSRSLTTSEAIKLAEDINRGVKLESYPAKFIFKATIGHRGVLVISSLEGRLSDKISNTDPAYTRVEGIGVVETSKEMIVNKCKPLDSSLEALRSAELVNEFTLKSHNLLKKHPINRDRARRKLLEANIILSRDAGNKIPKVKSLTERYGKRFICFAEMPVEVGIARVAGMDIVNIPPPSGRLEDDMRVRLRKLFELINDYDAFYIHIKGPDEPGHDGNAQQKKEVIEAIDKYFIEPLIGSLKLEDYIICITADHATPCTVKTHTDDPVPLLICGNNISNDGIDRFTERKCSNGSLGIIKEGKYLLDMLAGITWTKH
ncbi:MAG: alkaline phosphatase family protein [Candidatus Methanomethylicia archaeon]